MNAPNSLPKPRHLSRSALAVLSVTGLLMILPVCAPEQFTQADNAASPAPSGMAWTLIADGSGAVCTPSGSSSASATNRSFATLRIAATT